MNSKDSSKYKILKRLSQGAFGTIYSAIDITTGKQYALKQVELTRDRQSLVPRQLKILKKIDHPNLIKLIEVQQKSFRINMVFNQQPYDLCQLVQSLQYPVNKELVKYIFKQVLEGVKYLHQNKILHRDLKPANILINEKFVVKICDFGSAVQISQKQIKGQFDIEGFTKWYKAPEMLFGDRRYSENVDIWSLGCIFCQLLTGLPIFTANNQIQQIVKISNLLGSPDKDNWPSIIQLPDYGKIMFNKKYPAKFQQFFLGLNDQEIDLLKRMLNYQSRQSASSLLNNPYFINVKNPQIVVNWRNKQSNDDGYFNYQKLIPKK